MAASISSFILRLRRVRSTTSVTRSIRSWSTVSGAELRRSGDAMECAFPLCIDVGIVGRSARAPAARNVLGPRQPGRSPLVLRRGQALRRGVRLHVRSEVSARCAHHQDLQHLRSAHAVERRARRAELHHAGAAREPLTLYGGGEQARSFSYVSNLVRGIVASTIRTPPADASSISAIPRSTRSASSPASSPRWSGFRSRPTRGRCRPTTQPPLPTSPWRANSSAGVRRRFARRVAPDDRRLSQRSVRRAG